MRNKIIIIIVFLLSVNLYSQSGNANSGKELDSEAFSKKISELASNDPTRKNFTVAKEIIASYEGLKTEEYFYTDTDKYLKILLKYKKNFPDDYFFDLHIGHYYHRDYEIESYFSYPEDLQDILEKMKNYYVAAEDHNIKDYTLYSGLGMYYYYGGDYTKAISYLKSAIKEDPSGSTPFIYLARSESENGNYKDALDSALTGFRIEDSGNVSDENSPDGIIPFAEIISDLYIKMNDASAARDFMTKVYKKHEYWWQLVDISLNIALAMNKEDEIAYYTYVLFEKGPFQFFILDSMLRHYKEHDKLDMYILNITGLIIENTQHPDRVTYLLLYRGTAYHEMNNDTKAKADLTVARERFMKPDGENSDIVQKNNAVMDEIE